MVLPRDELAIGQKKMRVLSLSLPVVDSQTLEASGWALYAKGRKRIHPLLASAQGTQQV